MSPPSPTLLLLSWPLASPISLPEPATGVGADGMLTREDDVESSTVKFLRRKLRTRPVRLEAEFGRSTLASLLREVMLLRLLAGMQLLRPLSA
ncbi:hypothetical protein E2562_038035 [Oryza meyeriana var. granulata]|uniref:Secreted protein n=1 Tax=Oryza meyeriana var. granulata TaxID=110450 RepID=A0A6G1CLU6_9ORYZ|nr:hypothetical protein E2562_038035 [Oryza meyeriana var. granulata]